MQVEQKNIWEDVTRNAKRDNSNRAIAAYQANMPDAGAVAAFGGQEAYVQQKTAVSEAGNIDMATYSNPAKQGQEEKTVAEKIAGQEISSGQARSNEIAVVANTTSTEDLKKMEEDGFSISDADSHTIITVTDKIKAALAKAGVDVSSMGGTLTKEQLEEITGSPVVTQQIMDSLAANDLPATEENVQDSAEALVQAASIPEITKQAMSYLLKNDMEPTIRNLYLSNYSSSAENIVEPEQSGIDFGSLMPQIREIIAEAGLSDDEHAVDNSKWLVANQIPLTPENLQYLTDLQGLSDDLQIDHIDWNQIVDSMAKAIAAGKRPADASMITARRQMEEARLVMTSEASVAMEKAVVEMDLTPLADLVEDLKSQEREYYKDLLAGAGVEPSEKNVDLMAETMDVFAELKQQPAYVIGQVDADDSVQEIHDAGAQMQRAFAQANENAEQTEAVEQVIEEQPAEQPAAEGTPFSTSGNGQLVDDKENDSSKQFLTVQTKNGNTFYMVIDRSGTSENVYMMSLVDENDLAEFLGENEEIEKKEEPAVVLPETTAAPEPETTVQPETEVKPESGGNKMFGSAILGGGIVLVFGGLAAFALSKFRKKKEDSIVEEGLEFADDSYINEDEENAEDQQK